MDNTTDERVLPAVVASLTVVNLRDDLAAGYETTWGEKAPATDCRSTDEFAEAVRYDHTPGR